MTAHQVVSRPEWIAARVALMAREKALTKMRDELSAARRSLPWTRIAENYLFDSNRGKVSLADLFDGRSQLIVYHFMFNPDWQTGCKSCSFWADNFDPAIVHLNQRDVSMVAISRAPLAKLNAFKQRMGWTFAWVSSQGNSFNSDFAVSFSEDELKRGGNNYNFGTQRFGGRDAPGLSVFFKNADGGVFHTYSCYARGLDGLNGAYQLLDLVPKGRDEGSLSYGMEWVRLRDEYGK